jgi:hypothetical protein
MLLAAAAMLGVPLASGRAEAQPIAFRTVLVNCAVAGQTIANALRRQVVGGGLLVRISGACNEHVDIFRDDVILRGNPTATINGPTTADATVGIDNARRVSLESLTITGGSDGVVGRGSWFTLDTVTVQGAARLGVVASFGSQAFIDASVVRQSGSTGVVAANGSTVVITNSTAEQNAGGGIAAVRASHIRVGQDAQGSATLGPVIVQNNTGGGITVNDSSAGIIIASTIQNHTSNGIYIARGSHADVGIGNFSVVGANTIMNNGPNSSGILVEGASANIVGNTLTGNGFGVQFLNGGNGRLGLRPDSTAYIGNTISGNRLTGIQMNSGATAVIGGNNVSANGTAGTVGSRFGVFVSQSSANFIGQNVIENHPETGIFVRQGSLFLGNGFASLPTTGNIIRNNGCAPEAASNRSGVFLFEGATSEIRTTTLTQNCGSNIQLFLNGVLDLRGGNVGNPATLVPSIVSAAQVAPGGTPGGTHGISVGTRSSVRPGTGVLIDANPGDGVFLSNGGTLEIRNDVTTTISNNGGFPINCPAGQTETSILFPTSGGAATVFTGNGAGDAPSVNCTGY